MLWMLLGNFTVIDRLVLVVETVFFFADEVGDVFVFERVVKGELGVRKTIEFVGDRKEESFFDLHFESLNFVGCLVVLLMKFSGSPRAEEIVGRVFSLFCKVRSQRLALAFPVHIIIF